MALQNKPIHGRGEVWVVDFSPAVGSEIRDPHPALVVSVDELNKSPWGLIVICPISTFRKDKPFRLHVLLAPPEGGMKHISIIRCDQVKSLSIQRFSEKWGEVTTVTMQDVNYILGRILGL
jgi:mRNA interferase MazF